MKSTELKKLFYSEEVQTYAKTICELASECWRLGLSDSSGFSISQVIPGTSIVLTDKSGTGFRRNHISVDDLLLIDLDGRMLYQPSDNNPRKAPVNVIIHLEGYKQSNARGCIHWHDPFTNSFASYGKTIHPLTLQAKLIGDVPCVNIDDRHEKIKMIEDKIKVDIPSGFHSRSDVYFVMNQVASEVGKILEGRNGEFQRHGIAVMHYEHGIFSFGRDIEEAFDNGYRCYRNAQTIIYSRLLGKYPDKKLKANSGPGDTAMIF